MASAAGALTFAAGLGYGTGPVGGNGNGNGNGGNGGGGNAGGGGGGQGGGGQGGGQAHGPSPRPVQPGLGSGGRGPGGSFNVAPPAPTRGAPAGLPNLDQARRQQGYTPQAPTFVHSDLLPVCDTNCGGGYEPGGGGGSDPYFATARTEPENETGEAGVDLGSRNFNWGIPLVQLAGRAGLDLGVGLYYNSLVWTRQGSSIQYNADHGFPGPGFRLGFPAVQARYYDSASATYAYVMLTPAGGRVELRQIGTSNTYESADGSYTQLIDYGASALVRTTDGTQLSFVYYPALNEYRLTQIKDRNGNFVTVNYGAINGDASLGRPTSVVDTLGRVVYFNYDAQNYLTSITQQWRRETTSGAVTETHAWATFGYDSLYVQTNFPGLTVIGPNNTSIAVLTQVGLADGSSYRFDYTIWGQVYQIRHLAADGNLLAKTFYNLPGDINTPQSDCPRFTGRYDWVHWGVMNADAEVVTTYAAAVDGSWSQVTAPDGTAYKEFFHTSGWQRGLTYQTEVWSGGVRKKYTTIAWTQDDTSLSYPKNPRPYETNVYDDANNRRRTTVAYSGYSLPQNVREYAADGVTVLRHTERHYGWGAEYINRRVIGLPIVELVYEGESTLMSKVEYHYDWRDGYMQMGSAPSVQHDTGNYGESFSYGRGILTGVLRYNKDAPNDGNQAVWVQLNGYDLAGNRVWTQDASGHRTSLGYGDNYSDGNNTRNTRAYPTAVADPDNYSSSAQYNYDLGAVHLTTDPKGASVQTLYDGAGRVERVRNQVSGAYTRLVYPASGIHRWSYTTVQGLNAEVFTGEHYDGAGRLRAVNTDMPNSAGYRAVHYMYDAMGRRVWSSNPTEINASWTPSGDDASGWQWTQQTYDWQGRPLLTTYPTGNTTELSYGGCGCAGGEVTTARDERGRRRRLYKDALGRLAKVEELNWDQSVYATTTYAYNGRDQLTQVNQQGQLRTLEYDGHGRLFRRTTPEQGQTTYGYYADDAVQTVTDARGAASTLLYNNRHLVTNINYSVPAGVAQTSNVTYAYDEAGNRTSMTDGLGAATYHYDALSRLDWEERSFSGVGTYRLAYQYNLAGQLTGLTNPWNVQVGYTRDFTGQVTGVTGAGYEGVSSYAANLQYRAFGGLKALSYGNGRALSTSYDNRLRLTRWDVQGVLGWNYAYNYFNENSGRLTYAQSLYDATLDRSYDYDQVGRLQYSHTGVEARMHVSGQPSDGGGYGPYAHGYGYDWWGNLTERWGWGGENASYTAAYANNRRAGLSYDASGNVTSDGGQAFTYDAEGQQFSAYNLQQWYDGERLRAKKVEGGQVTYYLRSSVLGGKVVAELSGYGVWTRGYVYLGEQLLALQQGSAVEWVHQDPAVKSQRLTDAAGTVTAGVELDPWGGETGRSWNSYRQPQRFTSYLRDGNSSDEAMQRRYNRWWGRFDQPDPYDGSYDLGDPQSLNRYAYVQNDPVNFIDPSGLLPNIWQTLDQYGAWNGFGGWGGYDPALRVRRFGRDEVDGLLGWERSFPYSVSFWWLAWGGFWPQQPTPTPCSGSIPEAAARAILEVANQEGVDPTLLSVQWRHESSFRTDPPPNPRWEGRGRNRRLVGWDVGPMQLATNIWDKSPFTDGLPNVFGTIAMNAFTREYEGFNGSVSDNLRAGARAFTMDILPRSRGRDWLHRNADASGKFRGPAGYRQRYNEYLREAPGDRAQLDCLAGRR